MFSTTYILLTSAIDSLYNQEWVKRGLIPYRKDYLIDSVIRDNFRFEHIQYYMVHTTTILDHLYELLKIEESRGGWMKMRNAFLFLNRITPAIYCY